MDSVTVRKVTSQSQQTFPSYERKRRWINNWRDFAYVLYWIDTADRERICV